MTLAIRDLHAISSYSPSASSTRVRPNDWLRFFEIDATNHYYAGLNNNRPGSIVANPAAVSRVQFALRRLNLTGQRVILSRGANSFSQGEIEGRQLHRAGHSQRDSVFKFKSSFGWRGLAFGVAGLIVGHERYQTQTESRTRNAIPLQKHSWRPTTSRPAEEGSPVSEIRPLSIASKVKRVKCVLR